MIEVDRSPAGKLMEEAIELNLEGRSPYPDHAAFIDAGVPQEAKWIKRAFEGGLAVVLVAADGSARVIHANEGADQAQISAAQSKPARS